MWNIFDFIVVIGTWVVQIILKLDTGVDLKILGTLLRTLRIGRIFRIVKRVQAISIIFQTLIDALPAISSLGMLLGLLFFMYSIIGIGQFGSLMHPDDGQI
jgi:voltage-gated sodium channel